MADPRCSPAAAAPLERKGKSHGTGRPGSAVRALSRGARSSPGAGSADAAPLAPSAGRPAPLPAPPDRPVSRAARPEGAGYAPLDQPEHGPWSGGQKDLGQIFLFKYLNRKHFSKSLFLQTIKENQTTDLKILRHR